MNIKLIVDSASDMVPEEAEAMGVKLLPMEITFEDGTYKDGFELTHRQFFEKLIECGDIPKTSQISEYVFDEAIKEALENCDGALIITMSGKLSGTYGQAVKAAKKYGGKVRIVDSLSVAVGEYILVEYAHRLLAKGETLDEVVRKLEEKKRKVRLMALLGTLKYLRKGGRISAIASVSGELLNIKPVVAVVDGEVKLAGKAVGSKKGNNLLNKMIENTAGIDFAMPYGCVYSGLDSTVLDKYIADCSAIWKGHVDDIPRRMIGATIGTHIGPGAIAVAFFEK